MALGDVLGWMAQAPEVEVICAYAEGIRESAGFIAALDLARRNRKPIVMMKVGRSKLGGQAAQSHTASIAGDDAVTQAVLDEFGVVRARTTEEMLDFAYAAAKRIYPARNTLGVLTVSGGAGVLISDAAEAAGVPMPPMPEDAQARLRELVPFCAPRNPVDCTAQVTNNLPLITEFTESVARDGGYPSIMAFWSQVAAGSSVGPILHEQMRAVRAKYPGPALGDVHARAEQGARVRGGRLAGVRGPGARRERHRGHGPLRRRLRRRGALAAARRCRRWRCPRTRPPRRWRRRCSARPACRRCRSTRRRTATRRSRRRRPSASRW